MFLTVLEAVLGDCPAHWELTLLVIAKVFSGAPFLKQPPFALAALAVTPWALLLGVAVHSLVAALALRDTPAGLGMDR